MFQSKEKIAIPLFMSDMLLDVCHHKNMHHIKEKILMGGMRIVVDWRSPSYLFVTVSF